MNYTQNNIVMGLVGGDNNIFVMEDKQVFSKNWIYHHYTGFLNYTCVLTNSVIVLGLPNGP
jgi:hypothetical protein